jgi:hypothetical protein
VTKQEQVTRLLTVEEADAVADLLVHSGWRPLLKLVERMTRDQEEAVIRMKVSDGEKEVLHAKLRAEGARKLASDIEQLKTKFKKLEG